ncbi:hypothetical protein C4585_02140 [Candidatus Parcubacteria bacterium]|nr:MAG: hypothetical protein C4585_02140 [Candidatus Parcubacteria bacterium]
MDVFSRNKVLFLAFILIALIGTVAFLYAPSERAPEMLQNEEGETPSQSEEEEPGESRLASLTAIPWSSLGPVDAVLKDVGEAYMVRFGLTQEDFTNIKSAGFDIIEGNFDSCAKDDDVRFFLDGAYAAGLKVIMNAGAGEAEWGYPCDAEPTKDMVPTWQRAAVQAWVEKWKSHPALYAWDTSNEDGGTFPFGVGGTDPDPAWETKYALSVAQLSQAYKDVKSWDPAHPVMIRMNGWYFYDNADNFFRAGNAFGKDVADIVMINAYANVDEYFEDFVSTVLIRAGRAIGAVDFDTKLLPALGVWEEPPIWVTPTIHQLINDYNQAAKAENLVGIAFFKYGAAESEWHLPSAARGAPELWTKLRELIGS